MSATTRNRKRAGPSPAASAPVGPTEPWWATEARAHLEPPKPVIVTPEPIVAPPVAANAPVHPVAVCRWCGNRFYLAHVLPPQWLCLTEACADRQIAAAIPRKIPPSFADVDMSAASPWLFLPLPLNIDLYESPYKRTLLAGAAGSSKSYGARWMAYKFCLDNPGVRVLLMRSTYDELEKNHLQYMNDEAVALQTFGHGSVKYLGSYYKRCTFANGSMILMGFCAHDRDVPKHLGAEHDLIILEEAVSLSTRALTEIPTRDRGSPTARARGATDGKTWLLSNPGGIGMLTLAEFYIEHNPDPKEYPTYDPTIHGYIHATLEDNPYLAADYAQRTLSGLSAARYKQLRYGDWSVFTGQAFEFDPAQHVRELTL